MDKGKAKMEAKVSFIPQPSAKLPIRRKPLTCHHCDEPGHIRPNCPHRQVQRKKKWQAPKTPMCQQCGVSSHVKYRYPPLKHPKSPPRNQVPKHQQPQKPTQAKKTWIPKKTTEREISDEGTHSASSFMQDLVRFLALQLKNEGQDKDEDTHSPRGSRFT
jgi:RNase P subunit RPR2